MAKTIETAIPVRLRDRHRRAQLASDRRAGTHSRREVRALQRRWLRRHWMPIVLVAVLAIVMAGFINVFVWQPAAPYAIGALLASAAWWVYTMMLETGGVTPKRSGITAEQWTADELRKLRKGWWVVNHVMLVNSDVDHVLLGPGGFLAVETKFRSDWGNGMQNLESMARTAHNSAHDVASRLRLKTRRVQPLGSSSSSRARNEVNLPKGRDPCTPSRRRRTPTRTATGFPRRRSAIARTAPCRRESWQSSMPSKPVACT